MIHVKHSAARSSPNDSGDAIAGPHVSPKSHVKRTAARFGGWLADTIVPPVCIACHASVLGHDSLCPSCWSSIAFIRQPLCDRLGLPLPFGGAPGAAPQISAAAAADPPIYDRARSVAVFDDVVRRLVHGLKYADRHECRRLLGRWLTEAGRELFPGTDVIVPVPLTRWRLIRRQFNQSALLAHEVAAATGLPVSARLLMKTRTTPPQVGLTREQRRLNVRGAFAVPQRRRSKVEGRNVLLIDDVITTGATVGACARALKAAGAARVDVLSVGLVTTAGAITV